MTSMTRNRIVRASPESNDTLPWPHRLTIHRRDVDLFERLFSNWNRERLRMTREVHQTLDAIEAQLARLEQAVTMAAVA